MNHSAHRDETVTLTDFIIFAIYTNARKENIVNCNLNSALAPNSRALVKGSISRRDGNIGFIQRKRVNGYGACTDLTLGFASMTTSLTYSVV